MLTRSAVLTGEKERKKESCQSVANKLRVFWGQLSTALCLFNSHCYSVDTHGKAGFTLKLKPNFPIIYLHQ